MSAASAVAIPKELDRILALKMRPVLDCERERSRGGALIRRWAPKAQALIEEVTLKFSRGKRLSCACRDRHIVATSNGNIRVYHQSSPDLPPPPPFETTIDAFCRDNAHEPETVKRVADLRWGEKLNLKGLGHPVCMTELNPSQAWSLRELPRSGGLLGYLSVGSGKTVLGMLSPMAVPTVRTVVLLAKPNQRIHYRNHYLRLREHFHVPTLIFDTTTGNKDGWIVDGTPTVHFIPYSLLSNPKSSLLLEKQIDPDMVIADECHLLGNPVAARTARFLRLMNGRNGRIFCGWSGSLVHKSIKDVSHLSAHALGLGSPYPIPDKEVLLWSGVIDPVMAPDTESETAKELRMAFGAKRNLERAMTLAGVISDGGVRQGHRDRVIQTLGVISTKSSSVNCSISINEREIKKTPKTVLDVIRDIRNESVLRVGDYEETLVDQMEIVSTAREAGAGYYNYWAFPKATDEERKPGGLISQWFARRKLFKKALRAKLKYGEPHLDSPALCENAAERAFRVPQYEGTLPVWPEPTWPEWAEIKDQVEPDPRTKWIDDFLAQDAAEWARANIGVVWCHSRAFGKRVAQLAGLPYHGGGPNSEANILAEDGKRSIIASIPAHGESLDGLQTKFYRQLVAEVPSSGKGWEQLLGRLAREGQRADTVETEVYRHVIEYRDAFAKAVALAEFIEATTPNRQLILAADLGFDV